MSGRQQKAKRARERKDYVRRFLASYLVVLREILNLQENQDLILRLRRRPRRWCGLVTGERRGQPCGVSGPPAVRCPDDRGRGWVTSLPSDALRTAGEPVARAGRACD